jgi:membrane peptidoglycan carboxypeptidase
MKKRKRKKTNLKRILLSPYFKVFAALVLIASISAGTVFMHYYNIYATILDRRLSGEVFKHTAKIYAAPYIVYPGQEITSDEVLLRIRRAGLELTESAPFDDGLYQVLGEATKRHLVLSPERGDDFRLEFNEGVLEKIIEVRSGFDLVEAPLPPELVTSLFDDTRTKRRLVEFEQIPPHLSDALVASEDQRFYRHFGIDLIRAAGAFSANLRGQKLQGASTLTMQLAGSFFLNRRERTWNRKLPEIFIALLLETRLTKDQILTMYANEIYLGQRGTFAINGFGEAAAAYFGKDIGDLTLSEAATLVGIVPAPNSYSPRKNLERSIERRNTVIQAMFELDMINMTQLAEARGAELELAEMTIDATDAPYMVDYIREQLLSDFSEEQLINDRLKIYTTLDPDLQAAAVDAIALGIENADQLLDTMYGEEERPPVQASLIVLDPHTGAIKAMVGGRDYGSSQYNRVTEAFRQPGSIFKPFVYAAAFETVWDPIVDEEEVLGGDSEGITDEEEQAAPTLTRTSFQRDRQRRPESNEQSPLVELEGDQEEPAVPLTMAELIEQIEELEAEEADGLLSDLEDLALDQIPVYTERGTLGKATLITPLTTIMDEATIFFYEEDKFYRPNNYKDVFHGMITVREALQRSWNIPTVKVAQRIGYGRVADLAHRIGLNADIRPFPSIALGAFEVTSIEMAGAYTAFANEGVRVEPNAINRIVDDEGTVLRAYQMESREVLRPEMAYLMTHLLEGVVNHGTGAGVRARGFRLPAAGKTGTDSDGWFAGYTKNLLAIAWVGFDDNRELNLEGSQSALPIWTAFMLKANELYPVRDPEDPSETEFLDPPGVEVVYIDVDTGSLATPYCENRREQAFIYGTAPTSYCPIHSFTRRFFLSELRNWRNRSDAFQLPRGFAASAISVH